MRYYLIISETAGNVAAPAELKFFEWLKYLKKNGRVIDYWARMNKPGLAAILRLNFPGDLDELLAGWRDRLPSEFTVEPLMDHKALEAELAKKVLG